MLDCWTLRKRLGKGFAIQRLLLSDVEGRKSKRSWRLLGLRFSFVTVLFYFPSSKFGIQAVEGLRSFNWYVVLPQVHGIEEKQLNLACQTFKQQMRTFTAEVVQEFEENESSVPKKVKSMTDVFPFSQELCLDIQLEKFLQAKETDPTNISCCALAARIC